MLMPWMALLSRCRPVVAWLLRGKGPLPAVLMF